ncbi:MULTISPECIES: Insertion element protein [unclassified Pseudonocardia]|uniref:Insertion element protein n=1 Tax=unclassified Pseudonocardia TaxID=2619320 RepID=UPI002622A93C|nr:Insertion element protein [Pseudonocardia sp.]MCU1628547.1 Insertion element protein [Pseudonocardia sp.]MDT7702789.1 hypothetical protein [Pseudonocardiales bacterium]HEV7471165.1 Insertion element protein [Pseudonocardia sp.]
MTERVVPYHCPYCGEEDLRPAARSEKVPGAAWWCSSCLRTFVVTFVGIGVPETAPEKLGADS